MPDRDQIPRPARHLLYDLTGPLRRRRWNRVPGIERVPRERGIVLTFDDGPDERVTARILDALESAGARGTFFVLGERVREQPELAREVSARGHEVALHGMSHFRHDGLAAAEARAELASGAEAIEEVVGLRPRWYRPPFGRSSPELAAACDELGLGLAYWTAWGHDWEAIPARAIARRVRRSLEAGTIVLLHDSALYAQRDDAGPTVDAIPLIAAAAGDSPLITLGEAIGERAA
jgi:peptidoglycan/xylan/chitin deacetylase (PgdA/CDA1 family)